MIERTNAPALSQPPGYSHVVVASGSRLVTTAGAVPLEQFSKRMVPWVETRRALNLLY
jgi:hypothetical protein